MKNFLVLFILLVPLSGCLEYEVLIKVKPDGSGMIQQTMLLNDGMVEQMKSISEQFQQKGLQAKEFDIIDREKLASEAVKMGKGVTFSYVSRYITKDKQGYIAYYTFDDINDLMIDENDVSPDKTSMKATGSSESEKKEPIMFRFQRGKPSKLTIIQPDVKKNTSPDKPKSQENISSDADTTGLSALLEYIAGFRIKYAVQVEGTILNTNATYVEGNCITLAEVDFKQLAQFPSRLMEISKMMDINELSREEKKIIIQKIPGFKIEVEKNPIILFE